MRNAFQGLFALSQSVIEKSENMRGNLSDKERTESKSDITVEIF